MKCFDVEMWLKGLKGCLKSGFHLINIVVIRFVTKLQHVIALHHLFFYIGLQLHTKFFYFYAIQPFGE